MRFQSTKNLHEYVPTKFHMRRWGGTVDYVYNYTSITEPDNASAETDSVLELTESTELTNHNNNTILQSTPKKVRIYN